VGFTLGGFVAGEGSFTVARSARSFHDGTPRLRWVFQVTVASRDRHLLEALRRLLQVGSIHDVAPQRAHWQPTSTYAAASRRSAHRAVIPFAERYLLPGAKRRQFERWRDALLTFERTRPTRWGLGPSPCTVPGCAKPVRGRGLCRSHYRATGY